VAGSIFSNGGRTMSSVLTRLVKPFFPSLVLARRARALWQSGEPEARLLPVLCNARRTSVDIGGNVGAFAWHMRRLSRVLHVFEPVPELANRMKYGFVLDRSVHVHQVALSDTDGTATLRVPRPDGTTTEAALATIEADNTLANMPTTTFTVRLQRLDDVGLTDVAFMKIDVEGHELAVLHGGAALLARDHPDLMIEAENRHRADAVASVVRFLATLGYQGFFLSGGRLAGVESFDAAVHQRTDALDAAGHLRPGATYVNNFIFTTDPARLRRDVERVMPVNETSRRPVAEPLTPKPASAVARTHA